MTRRDDFSLALRYAAPPPMTPDQDELDALGIVRLIRRRFWQIVGVAALVVALALPLILGIKPTYYAGSRLLIQNPLTTALASSAEDRMVRLNLTTEVERMLSRDVAAQVIQGLGIDASPEFNPALREGSWIDRIRVAVRGILVADPAEISGPPVGKLDQVIAEYLAALSVAREPMSDVVSIGFVSEDPALAAAVPNALLDVYLTEREASLAQDIQRADDWLDVRIAEQTARVEAAEAALEAFEASSGLASGDPLTRANQVVAALVTTRADLEGRRFELTATLAEIEAAPGPAAQVALIESAAIEELDRDLRLRRNELERLLRTYGANHASVVAASSAVEGTEVEIEAEIDRHVQSMRAKLALLDLQDGAIATQLVDATEMISGLAAAVSRRDELRRIVDAEQATLERLQEQGRALAAEGKLPVADVEVLSPATPPEAPIGRGRLFYLVAATLVAGMLGLTIAAALEFLDRSVRSFQQLQNMAGLTEGVMVPAVSRRIAGSLAGLVDRGHEGRFGEALRALVLALKQTNEGRLPGNVLITSPLPGEGKSLIAAALAVEVAASGQRVLLVDGDSVHGSLHRWFGGRESSGFAEFLRGEAELNDIIRHDDASGVDYIARGFRAPGRLRESDRLDELIKAAKDSGRLLIFDSSPIFASVETTRLAMVVERTLLIIRWGRTRRDAVESAMQQLRTGNSAEMLGVINMVNPRRHGLYGFKESESYSSALRRYETSYS